MIMHSTLKNFPQMQSATWADCDATGKLEVSSGERPIQMCNSDGTGSALLSLYGFGADIIRFGVNEGVPNHTHEGNHILFVVKGIGTVEYNGTEHKLYPGLCYFIPGQVDHAIKAKEELVLIAVGDNHQPLDSEARMTPV